MDSLGAGFGCLHLQKIKANMLKSFIQVESKASKPIPWGDGHVTIWSRVVRFHFPRRSGGLIWNRPVSVSVRTAGGDERTLPIHDVTRQAQLWLLAAGLAGALGLAAAYRQARPARSIVKTVVLKQP
jgi:hypothetical protein